MPTITLPFNHRRIVLESDHSPMRREIYSAERLAAHARAWAHTAQLEPRLRRDRRLLARLESNREALFVAQQIFAEEVREGHVISPAAEWLLDNYYIVQDQLRQVKQDLSQRYYDELPKLANGDQAGHPRVYGLALELIAHTDSWLDGEMITNFVQAFQSVTPLTIGELWAVAIMLRVGLIENLRRLMEQATSSLKKRQAADAWADRLSKLTSRPTTDLVIAIADLARNYAQLDPVFTGHLLQRLRERDMPTAPVTLWLEQRLAEQGTSIEELVRTENLRRATNRVSIGNIITSMRTLASVDWAVYIDNTSVIEHILRHDPIGIYPSMDFASRDRYRHVIEQVSRRTSLSEQEVASRAVDLAKQWRGTSAGIAQSPSSHAPSGAAEILAVDDRPAHVGYYLIGRGAPALKAELRYRYSVRERLDGFVLEHPVFFYLGLSSIVTITLALAVVLYAAQAGATPLALVMVSLLTALPASIIAVSALNWAITSKKSPTVLPKLEFTDGVPEAHRTMVVIPALIDSTLSVQQLLANLETRFLANREPHLHFALLSDFIDAPQQHLAADEEVLSAATSGVQELNARYGESNADRFYLFHRQRVWNSGEGVWMGWERKRGKLMEFNRLLRGAEDTNFTVQVGDPSILPQVKYVITLDADTELPINCARRLVGTIAHPLNRARIDSATRRVVEGYGIIQPRTAVTAVAASATRFAQLYAGETGLDPYSHAVSSVYQDLFGSGIYVGKAIYDVDVMRTVLEGRFPDNLLLSHDLLEGTYARAGLATDIQLLEDFPSGYDAFVQREHRWIRGDWQITDWLLPRVPDVMGHWVRNSLSAIDRWKLLDNLRRSLMPLSLVLLLVAGWAYLPGSPAFWTVIGLMPIVFTFLVTVAANLEMPLKGEPWHGYLAALAEEMALKSAHTICSIAFLPYRAAFSLDAILRAIARRAFTRRGLLEWNDAALVERGQARTVGDYWARMWIAPALAVAIFALLVLTASRALGLALPVIALWAVSPFVAFYVSLPQAAADESLPEGAYRELRLIARKIWGFFEAFVGPEDHWLPPDNYQEEPTGGVAHRTSPTNIGFLLLSTVAARDFGFIGISTLADRLEHTISTLEQLARYRGHFYNWYDTTTLEPLLPEYISTVDSGNLAASLIVVKQACLEMLNEPIVLPVAVRGLEATLAALNEALSRLIVPPPGKSEVLEQITDEIQRLGEALQLPNLEIMSWTARLETLAHSAAWLNERVRTLDVELGTAQPEELVFWSERLLEQVQTQRKDAEQLLGWAVEGDSLRSLLSANAGGTGTIPTYPPSLAALARLPVDDEFGRLQNAIAKASLTDSEPRSRLDLLERLEPLIGQAQAEAARLITRYQSLAERAEALVNAMSFNFLFDTQREVFSVGYNLAAGRLDNSFYDLMASEARLASFVAIARGHVSARHWFRLARPLTRLGGRMALLSWGGTMFEYLMPRLLMQEYDGTLWHQTTQSAVRRQIQYGRQRGVPWGISESGFYAFDLQHSYQYQLFGVPDLSLKREGSVQLVVAPYATFLALPVVPRAAWENLRRLSREGGSNRFGFYEAIDYTPARRPKGQRAGIVRSFMAHHQGMSLVALDNYLNEQPMPRRLHAEPPVAATELLLHERVPRHAPLVVPQPTDKPTPRAPAPEEVLPAARPFTTPHTRSPRAHILSNGAYTVLVTNAGGGFSTYRDIAVTRWRNDLTRDHWGTFCYIKDLTSDEVWSAAYQPTGRDPMEYKAVFAQDRVEFWRRDAGIETSTAVTVSPEDHVEIRRITLSNRTRHVRVLELTSYAEASLDRHADDAAHPAFQKLFVETEFVPARHTLLLRRRPRSVEEPPLWALHTLCVEGQRLGDIEYETDRAHFLGRGRTAAHPAALDRTLSRVVGAVLDPVMSLRCRIWLAPGQKAQVSFVTGVGDSRERALALADEYGDPRAVERAFDLAWAHSQVRLRHVNISAEVAHLFQRLASRVLYPEPALRAPADLRARNAKGQSGLYAYGISGDQPIVLVRVSKSDELALVHQLLIAHEFWRLNNFAVDLVILNEHPTTYGDEFQQELQALIDVSYSRPWLDKAGGVFLRHADRMPAEDRLLLRSVARVELIGELGSLNDQLERSPRLGTALAVSSNRPVRRTGGTKPAQSEQSFSSHHTVFYNGTGGFDPEQHEYVIQLDKGQWTPLPWINVLANPRFGCLVSESGLGFTWSENSQLNRLTPWSNDPISDTPGEALYLRDEETRAFWSPTALPIRTDEPYRIRHGAGYTVFQHGSHGLGQELLVFVPNDDPVKVLRLRLHNTSTRARRISATYFVEWALGALREQSSPYVVTELDDDTGAVFARNTYNAEFGSRIAFVAAGQNRRGLTTNRTEFIGRNGALERPAALARTRLSGQAGDDSDPCAAIQTQVELKPGQAAELTFLLGQARHRAEARSLIRAYSEATNVQAAFEAVRTRWRDLLGTVQVQTPDPSMDLMLNQWLLYQALACRLWARTAFYQSGGAYGYRDQLQDVMSLVFAAPEVAREHIMRAAARQFVEGDVQHWWHPPGGQGLRTHISDDYLWLPFVTHYYVGATGDAAILDEQVPFLEAPPLVPDQKDAHLQPEVSGRPGSLYEHCIRALNRGLSFGEHGLPLMGTGDWNDAMNHVGAEGKGESVWLGWFLFSNLIAFAGIAKGRGDGDTAAKYREEAEKLKRALEEHGWDEAWYRRAYFDDGTPLGSAQIVECKIDSIAQSWAVISGAAPVERARAAMAAVDRFLVNEHDGLIHLLAPPFDRSALEPGYIKGYVPGIRENGGQYTHAALWVVLANVMLGEGDRAVALYRMLNPINHARTPHAVARYKVEPYVVAADVYSHPQHAGRGGWTWYTGSAGWMYRVGLEGILGLKRRGKSITIDPCIPRDWPGYQISYRHGSARYEIAVENPQNVNGGVARVVVDGVVQENGELALLDDGQVHRVLVVLGQATFSR